MSGIVPNVWIQILSQTSGYDQKGLDPTGSGSVTLVTNSESVDVEIYGYPGFQYRRVLGLTRDSKVLSIPTWS
jgi:hypothetical protein